MSGTVNIARSIFDHELFADQTLTEREAWIWLIMEASWKPRKKRVGDYIVDLERGQLAASVRFMAGAWKWTPAKVQRFLKRLQSLEMISVKTDTGVSVVSVCNYDEYQSQAKSADTGPIQDRYRSDTNEKKGEIREEGKEEDTNVSLSSSAPDRSLECLSRFNAIAKQVGWPEVQKFTPPRKAALSQRIADVGGVDAWIDAMTRASNSPLLTGQNNRQWRADFDWLQKPANFTKLMEGNYDPRPTNQISEHHAAGSQGRAGFGRGTVDAFATVASRYAGRPQ